MGRGIVSRNADPSHDARNPGLSCGNRRAENRLETELACGVGGFVDREVDTVTPVTGFRPNGECVRSHWRAVVWLSGRTSAPRCRDLRAVIARGMQPRFPDTGSRPDPSWLAAPERAFRHARSGCRQFCVPIAVRIVAEVPPVLLAGFRRVQHACRPPADHRSTPKRSLRFVTGRDAGMAPDSRIGRLPSVR